MYYYYYHCCSGCGCRYKADEVNKVFFDFLSLYILNPATAELFKMVILDEYSNDTTGCKEYKLSLAKQLTDLNNRSSKARELLLAGDLDSTDYKDIKAECDRGILFTEAQLTELGKNKYTKSQLEPIIDKAITTYTNLNVIYYKSENEEKRRLISSMFPEKITFENLKHRTAKVNDRFNFIYLISN